MVTLYRRASTTRPNLSFSEPLKSHNKLWAQIVQFMPFISTGLAFLCYRIKDYLRAESFYLRSLAITEKSVGAETADSVTCACGSWERLFSERRI